MTVFLFVLFDASLGHACCVVMGLEDDWAEAHWNSQKK